MQIKRILTLAGICILSCLPVLGKTKEKILYITPKNWEIKKSEIIPPMDSVVFRVSRADFIDWESLTPTDYEGVYERLRNREFLSQFSMKRGYRLEPFLPLLFPKTPETLENLIMEKENTGERKEKNEETDSTSIQKQITQIKWDINQTFHEIHREQFLKPLREWCLKRNIQLQYVVRATNFVPIEFLMEDAIELRHPVVSEPEMRRESKIAQSVGNQVGSFRLQDENSSIQRSADETGVVLLVPSGATCDLLDGFQDADVLCEFQIPYVKITLKPSAEEGKTKENAYYPEIGFGAKRWKKIRLAAPQENFCSETQLFLDRLQKYTKENMLK